MRTTLEIDDDVLLAARELARLQGVSIGKAVSDMARKGISPAGPLEELNGMPLLPTRRPGVVVTPELVNQLREEDA